MDKIIIAGILICLSLFVIGCVNFFYAEPETKSERCKYSELFYENEIPQWYGDNCIIDNGGGAR